MFLPRRRSTRSSRARTLDTGEFIFDVQGHFVNPTGAWTTAAAAGRAAAEVVRAEQEVRRRGAARTRVPGLPERRRVHQGRVPRLGHRPVRAVVRAVDAQGRAADDRGGRRDRRASSSAWRARTGCCCTVASTRTRTATSTRWTCWPRSTRSPRGRPTRNGGRTARASSSTTTSALAFIEKARKLGVRNIAVHKGLPFGAAQLRALDVRRHRSRRQALSGRQLPHLPLGFRRRQRPRVRTIRSAPTASTRWSRACAKTASSPARTSTPSSDRRGAS